MRRILLFVLLMTAAGVGLAAEEGAQPAIGPAGESQHAASPVETTWVVRTGQRMQAPMAATYRLIEYSQQRGRWIVPDVGYYDIGHTRSEIWFAGAGFEMRPNRHIDWTQIFYIAQTAGREAHNERMFWIWPVVDVAFNPRWSAEAVVYPTIPLNRSQRWGLDVDRVKLEYRMKPHMRAGLGLKAATGGGMGWERDPFLTMTCLRDKRNVEFWVQRIPDGAAVQVRYQIVRKGIF